MDETWHGQDEVTYATQGVWDDSDDEEPLAKKAKTSGGTKGKGKNKAKKNALASDDEDEEKIVFKVRRPLKTKDGQFVFSENDPVDEMVLDEPIPTIEDAMRTILTTLKHNPDEVLKDSNVKGLKFTTAVYREGWQDENDHVHYRHQRSC
eukprot:448008-Amphidinium_carterae.1